MTFARWGRSPGLMGIVLTLASYLMWSAQYATAKALSSDYSEWQLLFMRSLGVLGLVLLSGRVSWRWPVASAWSMSLWVKGVCQFASAWCFFHAAEHMPLGTVTVLYSSAPIVVLVLSVLWLREQVGWKDGLAVALGLLGVTVAVPPAGGWLPGPLLAALLSGFFWGVTVVLSRHWRDRGTISAQLLATSALFAVLSALGMDFRPVTSWRDAGLFGALALQTFAAQWFFLEACKRIPAKVMGPLEYSSIVWALLIGLWVFGEHPDMALLAGAAMVVGSGYLASRGHVRQG